VILFDTNFARWRLTAGACERLGSTTSCRVRSTASACPSTTSCPEPGLPGKASVGGRVVRTYNISRHRKQKTAACFALFVLPS
jgi:hypothetical protein